MPRSTVVLVSIVLDAQEYLVESGIYSSNEKCLTPWPEQVDPSKRRQVCAVFVQLAVEGPVPGVMAQPCRFCLQQNRRICLWEGEECNYAKRVGEYGRDPHGPAPAQMTVCDEVTGDWPNDGSDESGGNEHVKRDPAADRCRPNVGQGAPSHGHGGGAKCTTKEAADHDGPDVLSERHRKAKC